MPSTVVVVGNRAGVCPSLLLDFFTIFGNLPDGFVVVADLKQGSFSLETDLPTTSATYLPEFALVSSSQNLLVELFSLLKRAAGGKCTAE